MALSSIGIATFQDFELRGRSFESYGAGSFQTRMYRFLGLKAEILQISTMKNQTHPKLILIALVLLLSPTNSSSAQTPGSHNVHPTNAAWSALTQSGIEALRQQNFPLAKQKFTEALSLVESLGPCPSLCSSLNNLGYYYKLTGDYSNAQKYYERALAMHRTVFGPQAIEITDCLCNLGSLYLRIDKKSNSVECLEEALKIQEKAFGDKDAKVIGTLITLGESYRSAGQLDKAEQSLSRAFQLIKTVGLPRSPDGLQDAREVLANNLGLVYMDQGRFEQARTLFTSTLQHMEKTKKESTISYATTLNNLAMLEFKLANFSEAEIQYKRTLDQLQSTVGEKNGLYARTLQNYAHTLMKENKTREAYAADDKARKILNELHLNPDTP